MSRLLNSAEIFTAWLPCPLSAIKLPTLQSLDGPALKMICWKQAHPALSFIKKSYFTDGIAHNMFCEGGGGGVCLISHKILSPIHWLCYR